MYDRASILLDTLKGGASLQLGYECNSGEVVNSGQDKWGPKCLL
jgi:hypothetical protein